MKRRHVVCDLEVCGPTGNPVCAADGRRTKDSMMKGFPGRICGTRKSGRQRWTCATDGERGKQQQRLRATWQHRSSSNTTLWASERHSAVARAVLSASCRVGRGKRRVARRRGRATVRRRGWVRRDEEERADESMSDEREMDGDQEWGEWWMKRAGLACRERRCVGGWRCGSVRPEEISRARKNNFF
jgi:hypothetical protein